MKKSVARVLLFCLIVSVFMICTVSAAANKPGTCSPVGTWNTYDIQIGHQDILTFYEDGTYISVRGYTGTWTVVDATTQLYQMDTGISIWTVQLTSNQDIPCSGIIMTDTAEAHQIIGTRSISPPVAAFEATPLQGPLPLKVTFTDSSTGEITTRTWEYKLNTASSWTTFTLDRKSAFTFTNPGFYDIRLTVVGPGGPSEALKSLTAGCDFTTQPDIEKCFGGIGVQCSGVSFLGINLVRFTPVKNTCNIAGYTSIGSMLHDQCCIASENTGVMCGEQNPFSLACQKEWNLAENDVIGGCKNRMWSTTFGPYYVGTKGDSTVFNLIAPPGMRIGVSDVVNEYPDYHEICLYSCPTRTCKTDASGNIIIYRDKGSWSCQYVMCQ